jgi:hypothetical protein
MCNRTQRRLLVILCRSAILQNPLRRACSSIDIGSRNLRELTNSRASMIHLPSGSGAFEPS